MLRRPGALSLLALLSLGFLSLGAAGTDDEEPAALPEILSGDAVVLETSSDPMDLAWNRATRAAGFLIIADSCAALANSEVHLVPSGEDKQDLGTIKEKDAEESLEDTSPDDAKYVAVTSVGQSCRVELEANIKASDSATGIVLVTVADTKPDLAVPYIVQRSSRFAGYAGIFVAALVFAVAAAAVAGLGIRSKVNTTDLPAAYSFTDGWASKFTAIGAAGGALLAGTGILSEFIPQYRTGGILASSVVVGVLLALAPATFLAFTKGGVPTRKGLVIAAGLTLLGVCTQLLLALMLVLNAGLNGIAVGVCVSATIVVLAVTAMYSVKSICNAPVPKNPPAPAPGQPPATLRAVL